MRKVEQSWNQSAAWYQIQLNHKYMFLAVSYWDFEVDVMQQKLINIYFKR